MYYFHIVVLNPRFIITDALRIEAQLESEADFARGFRLGVLIMLNVMTTE